MRKEYRSSRDNYVLTFNDDEEGVSWTTGNLSRFLRNLWVSNPILQKLNPEKNAYDYALRMVSNIGSSLYLSENITVNFYLVPRSADEYRAAYSGTITRNTSKSMKLF